MVDPNRKINRLTDEDIDFLDECEKEFGNRYTDEDLEFVEHCSKDVPDPPILENWASSGNGGGASSGGSGGYNNRNNNTGGGQRNYRGGDNRGSNTSRWQGRNNSGGRYENDRHDRRYQTHRENNPYGKFQRRSDEDGRQNQHQQHQPRDQRQQQPRDQRQQQPRDQRPAYGKRATENRDTSPQDTKRVRRDYGNFVPASKD